MIEPHTYQTAPFIKINLKFPNKDDFKIEMWTNFINETTSIYINNEVYKFQ